MINKKYGKRTKGPSLRFVITSQYSPLEQLILRKRDKAALRNRLRFFKLTKELSEEERQALLDEKRVILVSCNRTYLQVKWGKKKI